MMEFVVRPLAPPAPLRDGELVLAHTAGADGAIGVLATTEWELARGFRTGPHGNRLPAYEPDWWCPATLYRYQHPGWHRMELGGLPVSYPDIALLPEGELLVVGPGRPADGERTAPGNAHVFGPDGTHRRRYALGGSIHQIIADEAGTLWTTHGEQSWPDFPSLIRWDVRGEQLWDSGIACDDEAVNVAAGTVWAYRRPDLVRLRADEVAEYASPVDRVHALAFRADRLLLAGPGDELSWCAVHDDGVERLAGARLLDPTGRPIEDWDVVGAHGSRWYLRADAPGYHVLDIGTG